MFAAVNELCQVDHRTEWLPPFAGGTGPNSGQISRSAGGLLSGSGTFHPPRIGFTLIAMAGKSRVGPKPKEAAPASPHRGPAPTAAEIATDQRRRSRMHGAPPATRRVETKKRQLRSLREELAEQEE